MTAVVTDIKTGRSLVPVPLYERLVERVATDEGVNRNYAARVMDQALAFLGTCAVSAVPLSPSETVDPGWHTFILHAQEYSAFCDLVAGRFIHHIPNAPDDPGAHGAAAKAVIKLTVAEIRRVGFMVDDELWWPSGARCSQCHNGCTDSPRLD